MSQRLPNYDDLREYQARATADRLDGHALAQQILAKRRNQCIQDGRHDPAGCQRCGQD